MATIVDLRSDTVTRPSQAMRKVMSEAEVGDDVFGEDPTANRLQEKLADLLGMEAALFVPSGTMGNEICIKALTRPGDEVICESGCHIFRFESGAAAFLSGVQMRPISGQQGVITVEQVEAVINPTQDHFPQTTVITIENTHNFAGGRIFPLEQMVRLYELSRARGLKLHLDGARLWNASAETGIALKKYVRYCDTVSVCFSKGLGAPVGSAVAGSAEFITEAHRLRKIYGGGMRQIGILAAAALYGLENHLSLLPQDHEHARLLAQGLAEVPGIRIELDSVQTNIVIFDVDKKRKSVVELTAELQQRGVLMIPFGGTRIRAVTHLNISRQDVESAIKAVNEIMR